MRRMAHERRPEVLNSFPCPPCWRTAVCWRRLAGICVRHGFVSVESAAEKSKLEGAFQCIASVKCHA